MNLVQYMATGRIIHQPKIDATIEDQDDAPLRWCLGSPCRSGPGYFLQFLPGFRHELPLSITITYHRGQLATQGVWALPDFSLTTCPRGLPAPAFSGALWACLVLFHVRFHSVSFPLGPEDPAYSETGKGQATSFPGRSGTLVDGIPRRLSGRSAGGFTCRRGPLRTHSSCFNWQARRDSNPQHPVLETGALAVRATGLFSPSYLLSRCRVWSWQNWQNFLKREPIGGPPLVLGGRIVPALTCGTG